MKKGVKIALVLASVSAVALIGFSLIRRRKSNKLGEVSSSPIDSVKKVVKSDFPLKKGDGMGVLSSPSPLVMELQKHLNEISPSPLLPIKVDGKFGDNTEKRLMQMYKVNSVSEKLFNDKIKSSFSKDDLFSW